MRFWREVSWMIYYIVGCMWDRMYKEIWAKSEDGRIRGCESSIVDADVYYLKFFSRQIHYAYHAVFVDVT